MWIIIALNNYKLRKFAFLTKGDYQYFKATFFLDLENLHIDDISIFSDSFLHISDERPRPSPSPPFWQLWQTAEKTQKGVGPRLTECFEPQTLQGPCPNYWGETARYSPGGKEPIRSWLAGSLCVLLITVKCSNHITVSWWPPGTASFP